MINMTPKTIDRLDHGRRTKRVRHCQIQGCSIYTRNGKPYCTAHVEHHAHIKALFATFAVMEEEDRRVIRKGHRAVDVEGNNAKETFTFLRANGPRTVPRLARDLNRNPILQAFYVEALRRAGLVKTTKSTRGVTIVTVI